jgi:type II secretory pathway component PulF
MIPFEEPHPPRAKPSEEPSRPKRDSSRRPKPPGDDPPAGTRSRRIRDPIPATGGPKLFERVLFGRVSSTHLASFCRQFAAYGDAGVDLIRSLQSLQGQFARTALGPILERVIIGVRQGDALSDAMQREPAAFDRLFLSMVRVAEARGGIPETMRMLADQYDARVRLIRSARSAMIYPVIVLIVAAGVVALMTVWVLPMMASMLADLARKGGEGGLPLPSRILMAFSSFVQGAGWWLMPLIALAVLITPALIYRNPSGKAAMDELGLYVPVLGRFLRLIETARFTRTLGTLLNAGVDMNSSLDLTAGIQRLAPYRRAVEGAKGEVMHGADLSEGLVGSRRFGHDVIAIVESGEETGRLPESLAKLADDYEERVSYMVKNLGSLVQPLIMIIMGLVVLFIILAVFLPYIQALTSAAQ